MHIICNFEMCALMITLLVLFVFSLGVCAYVFMFKLRENIIFWPAAEQIIVENNPIIPNVSVQQKMMKIYVPFKFKLAVDDSASGLSCIVSGQIPYSIYILWGISIKDLYRTLYLPWNTLENHIKENTWPEGCCQEFDIVPTSMCICDKEIAVPLEKPSLNLGPAPRVRYPLVVMLIRDSFEDILPEDVVALVNVVHIQDDICALKTCLLAQYLKLACGQVTHLKKLYCARTDMESNIDTQDSESDSEKGLCVVCQSCPFSRALLPCRHACVCANCFGKLQYCPLCRTLITSYFCLSDEDYVTRDTSSSDDNLDNDILSRMQQWTLNLFEMISFPN